MTWITDAGAGFKSLNRVLSAGVKRHGYSELAPDAVAVVRYQRVADLAERTAPDEMADPAEVFEDQA